MGDYATSLDIPLGAPYIEKFSKMKANCLDYLGLMSMSAPFQFPRIFRSTPVWVRLRLLLLDVLLIIGQPVK